MRIPEDYIMGTSDKSRGCGGSFWFFIIAMIVVTVGVFTGTMPIILAVAGGIAVVVVLIIVILAIISK